MEMKDGKKKVASHEMFRIGAALAFVGGFLDAYTYILRGGVFANAQTGNVVLLGIHTARGEVKEALYYVLPIVAFVMGVLLTEYMKHRCSVGEYQKWERIVILVEIMLLTIVGFLPLHLPNGFSNITIAFVCSLQVNSFRKIHNITYASTMCTGNLRSGTENFFKALLCDDRQAKKNYKHYFGILLLFLVGVAIGTWASESIGTNSIWICSGILTAVWLAI